MSFSTNTLTVNTGYNTLTVRNNSADFYQIYRQYPGLLPEKICALCVPDGPTDPGIFNDYNAIRGIAANYWAEAFASPSTSLGISAIRTGTQIFGGAYLHKVARGVESNISGSLMHLFNQEGSSREISVAANIIDLPTLDKPIIEVSTTVQRVWRLPLLVTDLTDGTREILNGWIETHSVLNCRDDRGRQMFGAMLGAKEKLDLTGDYPFELHEIDYRENITWE